MHTSVVNLYPHLMCLRRANLNILNAQVLASLPGNGGLASDRLALCRHCSFSFNVLVFLIPMAVALVPFEREMVVRRMKDIKTSLTLSKRTRTYTTS